ncbi:MAG: hypothetical protein WC538_13615 [Thermoanaerobaculia bacterium]|jgi:hypothetical protein
MDMKQPCTDYTLERWLAIFLGLLFLLPWVARAQEPCGATNQFPLQRIDDVELEPMLVRLPVDDASADALSEQIALRAEEHDARLRRGRYGLREASETRFASVVAIDPLDPGAASPQGIPASFTVDIPESYTASPEPELPNDRTPRSLIGVAGLLAMLGVTLVAISPRVG